MKNTLRDACGKSETCKGSVLASNLLGGRIGSGARESRRVLFILGGETEIVSADLINDEFVRLTVWRKDGTAFSGRYSYLGALARVDFAKTLPEYDRHEIEVLP